MDKWKLKEIRIMELGGNKKAHAYYTKNGMFVDGRPNHENPLLSKYKLALAKQALADIESSSAGKTNTIQEAPATAQPEEDKNEDNFFDNIKETPPVAAKIVSNDNQTSSSIYSFSNFKQPNQPANLNAKKLDIDFGGDDFFDSFGMGEKEAKTNNATANDNPFAIAESVSKDESGPFRIGGAGTKSLGPEGDEFVKQKLKELEGKKAISSEDFKQESDNDYKERLAKFKGATAISSADFFGEEKKDDSSSQGRASLNSLGRDSFGDKVSEAAIYAADAVAQRAKQLKEKASNFWTSLRYSK